MLSHETTTISQRSKYNASKHIKSYDNEKIKQQYRTIHQKLQQEQR